MKYTVAFCAFWLYVMFLPTSVFGHAGHTFTWKDLEHSLLSGDHYLTYIPIVLLLGFLVLKRVKRTVKCMN